MEYGLFKSVSETDSAVNEIEYEQTQTHINSSIETCKVKVFNTKP